MALLFAGTVALTLSTPLLAEQAMGTPDAVKRGYVDSRFGQIHYRISASDAPSDNKPALIALHLSPNSSQVFSSFLPIMAEDRTVIAPDYPGYGMSDPIQGEQRIYDYAKAMLDVLDALELSQPVDLLGYHTGTAVALEMARQQPDRIRRMVLVAVPVLTEEERAAGAALPMISFDEGGEFVRSEWQRSWKWKGPGQSKRSVLATFAEKMRPGVRERGAKAVLAYDLAPVLVQARHPILIVRVKDDLWEPSKRAHELRPDAEYTELPNYGHGLFHAAPGVMVEISRQFLDAGS